MHNAVFAGDVAQVVDQLRGEGGGRVLVRLMLPDAALRSVPWEVMVGPGELDGPLACHPGVRLVRGVFSNEPAVPREVRGPLRILAVATAETSYAVEDMRAGLTGAIAAGRVEWLEPAIGMRWTDLLQRLHGTPRPHVVHFVCHGRVAEGGEPELLLDPEAQRWTPMRTLATALTSNVGAELRLVYLEACAGADAGALASAAEHLVARGVEGVIAHLWPVGAIAARRACTTFYDALVGAAAGDVTSALNTARLAVSGTGTAEFLSPVLVLRGHEPVLFDIKRQGVEATASESAPHPQARQRLVDALLDMFSGEELRRFARYGAEGEGVSRSLPGATASAALNHAAPPYVIERGDGERPELGRDLGPRVRARAAGEHHTRGARAPEPRDDADHRGAPRAGRHLVERVDQHGVAARAEPRGERVERGTIRAAAAQHVGDRGDG